MKYTCKLAHNLILCSLLPVLLFAQVERWVYTYNGSGNAEDEAYVVTYGDDGNIYAAGYSTGNNTGQDFTVISLTPQGNERWVYIYNGDNDSTDIANDIICGLDGNIYACGTYTDSISGNDCFVVSLTTDGVERWTYAYSGSVSPYYDEFSSITYGDDGNIYVTGKSYLPGNDDDIIVVSLTSQGSERWIRRYHWEYDECAKDIIYGLDGNLYIGCRRYNWSLLDIFAVISLDTGGSFRWSHGWGFTFWGDIAVKVIYGVDHNIYATGMEGSMFIVRSYDTTGTYRWTYSTWPPTLNSCGYDVVYGDNDNLYAAGRDHDLFHIISISTLGDTNWIYLHNSSSGESRSIIYGLDDKLYAVGWALDTLNFAEFTVIRVDTTGTEDWIYCRNSSGDGHSKAYSIVQGTDHHLYTTGCGFDSVTNSDIVIISLDTTPIYINEEKQQCPLHGQFNYPTILTGPLQLTSDKPFKIFDITGRTVLLGQMKPGVYFIQMDGRIVNKVIKIR